MAFERMSDSHIGVFVMTPESISGEVKRAQDIGEKRGDKKINRKYFNSTMKPVVISRPKYISS